ncbi:VOC family protein [Anaerobium acetethylicum]|uniref:Lactoylglutathione lyase/methylmalonyl-CoA/ethylmalonyl-CoA epimerase n=1 Tax=Anaerobium acetethylicum TaxID=1619234 RepID=A0A1D3TYG0_9FIRM|nr:VOC family protein [Anaerobium acetethylicum]SCP99465.1 lactoylglutathione lyase/methylmalonyl-CoA/ethylmalonyl-CoA epimerase [Anaerobium acetethylicum]
MKPMRLHHVGIVMTTMDKAEAFLEQFGLEKDYMEYVEAYHANCLFTKYTDKESPLELIIPTEGVLTEYNKGKGGIHHIAFEVEDVKAARAEFTANGMEMLEDIPVEGAGGIIVNFLRPRYGLGVLVEFVQQVK